MKVIAQADARYIPLASGTVQTCVTSPPYYGLRDYGVTGQIGLEQTPEEYVANLVAVFREVRRVLRDDGTLWLNLGDSYNGSAPNKSGDNGYNDGRKNRDKRFANGGITGLKPKDLLGIPWMVAFALRADGWYLRSEIIWHKPNPMPESVRDRPTKAHEQIFLLSKQARYYYDQEAVREGISNSTIERWSGIPKRKNASRQGLQAGSVEGESCMGVNPAGRNRRSVWTVATAPYSGAHFATFPPKLIEPCILAGTSAKGQCPRCGAPWVRVVEKEGETNRQKAERLGGFSEKNPVNQGINCKGGHGDGSNRTTTTLGWQPSCTCDAGEPIPQIVLDPFSGSGTTGMVSLQHGRRYVGLELNMEYIELSKQRTSELQGRMGI